MLLGNKKTQKKDQNWCLILNPLYNEIDKRKVSRKITESFGLSAEEAGDLVNNTPIILLDDLSQEVAAQVKDYFRPTGAELLMTNEVYLKRKCYRTVWPEEPNLSFLTAGVRKAEAQEPESKRLHPEEALHEMRTLSSQLDEEVQKTSEKIKSGNGKTDSRKQQLLMGELEQLKKERDLWREKYDTQRRTSEKLGWELSGAAEKPKEEGSKAPAKEELERQQKQIARERERYEELEEEYRQARSVFEEKLFAASEEARLWKEKASSVSNDRQGIDEEKELLNGRLQNQEAKLDEWKKKNQVLEEELSQIKLRDGESKNRLKQSETLRAELEQNEKMLLRKVKKQEDVYAELEEAYQRVQDELEEKMSGSAASLTDAQEKIRSLEKNQIRLIDEMEQRSVTAQEWERKSFELETTIQELRESHDSLEKMLRVNMKQLETREKELEQTKKQLQELTLQREHQEILKKRAEIASQIAVKESKLQGLVKEQQKVEAEIREREERINEILTEQESVEKEILDGKQVSRHYLEQIQKDKAPRLKSSRRPPMVSRPADQDDDAMSDSDD